MQRSDSSTRRAFVPCNVKHGKCLCGGDEFFDGEGCAWCDEHCEACDENCTAYQLCAAGFVVSDGSCVASSEFIKTVNAEGVPTRCTNGFFLDSSSCLPCDETCAMCLDVSTCLSCGDGIYLSGASCVENDVLDEVCDLSMTNGMGCALCKQGFVRIGTTCAPCSDNCASCNNKRVHRLRRRLLAQQDKPDVPVV